MNIPDGLKPHLVASVDKTRYVLCNVAFQQGMMVATDGRRLVACEASKSEDDTTDNVLIPPRAFKLAKVGTRRSKKSRSFLPAMMLADDSITVAESLDDKVILKVKASHEKYPQWQKVVPDDKPQGSITLNTKLLASIADAIGNDLVTIHFGAVAGAEINAAPLLITTNRDDCFGVLMTAHNGNSYSLASNRVYQQALAQKLAIEQAAPVVKEPKP